MGERRSGWEHYLNLTRYRPLGVGLRAKVSCTAGFHVFICAYSVAWPGWGNRHILVSINIASMLH
jgi:hypothetical protein